MPARLDVRSAEGMNALAQAYVASLRAAGIGAMVANLSTRIETLRVGNRVLPLTINQSEPTGTYVCSPHTAYVRYLREELTALPLPLLRPPLAAMVSGFDRMLRAARIDDIVHLNNWLLSTNLNGGLDIGDTAALAAQMTAAYPNSIIAIRSLNGWADRKVLDALVRGGWDLFPSRQIWVIDDFGRNWQGRRDTRRDRALADAGKLAGTELDRMNDADAARIAHLYALLYLDKYSRLNPDFTPAFIKTTHDIGMLRYLVWRDQAGTIQSVAGCFGLGGELSAPIVGYDTARPASEGLYRLATYAILRTAAGEGLRVNLSSGAAGFKRNRGARPEIEYAACFVRHLPARRRLIVGMLRQALDRVGVPILRRYQL